MDTDIHTHTHRYTCGNRRVMIINLIKLIKTSKLSQTYFKMIFK